MLFQLIRFMHTAWIIVASCKLTIEMETRLPLKQFSAMFTSATRKTGAAYDMRRRWLWLISCLFSLVNKTTTGGKVTKPVHARRENRTQSLNSITADPIITNSESYYIRKESNTDNMWSLLRLKIIAKANIWRAQSQWRPDTEVAQRDDFFVCRKSKSNFYFRLLLPKAISSVASLETSGRLRH